jgi:cell division septation protein DedD
MAGKGTRHRFELSRLEIVGVLGSATAGLFVVFLLGLYAGRGLADRRVDGGDQLVRLPVAPAVEQTPGTEAELTFYDTLEREGRMAKTGGQGGGEHRVAVPPSEEAPVLASPSDRALAKVTDAAPMGKPAVPEPAAKVEKPAKGEASVKEEPAAKTAKEDPARQAAAPIPFPTAASKGERTPAAPSTPRSSAKGEWSVQVSATRDPRTADTVLRRLQTKGYDAFVLKIRRRGETFYRVRVGHYVSLEEAQQVVSRLRREPGVPEAFVASD